MEEYFRKIVSNLILEDMLVLGYLDDKGLDTAYKAVKRSEIQEETNLTQSLLRKVIYKLESTNLIEIDVKSKEHKIYITNYGKLAVKTLLKESE